jgi:cation transport regulator ChaC
MNTDDDDGRLWKHEEAKAQRTTKTTNGYHRGTKTQRFHRGVVKKSGTVHSVFDGEAMRGVL